MVTSILRRSTRAFTSEQHTILSAATVIGSIYGLSAFLGFIRNRLLSGYFGDSSELGIYFAADVIPNLILSIIVSGALSSAFIPVFTKYYKKDQKEAWKITSSVLNVSLVLFLIISLGVIVGSKWIAGSVIARSSDLSVSDIALMARLMRVMMVAQIVFIFSNFFTSILQSFKRFVIPSLAPVLYNVGIIVFILLFVKRLGVFAPAYGMIFGAFLHMGIQLPFVKKLGFFHSIKFDIRNKGVREIYKLLIPRTIGQAAQKLIVPLNTNLALFISAPSNVILNFATDIQSLPVRVFGISIGQAALPLLTASYKEHDQSEFKGLLIRTIHQVIFFVLPISVLIFILRVPLVRLAVGARKYSWEATVMTAYAVGFYSISLVAQSLILVIARAFYALCDTKTPFKISLISIVVNASLAIYFVKFMHLGVWSVALAYSIGSVFNCLFLFVSIVKRLKGFYWDDFFRPINQIGFATLITGIALYVPLKVMDELVFDTTRTIWLIVLTMTVTVIGFITYILLARALKISEYRIIADSFKKLGIIKRFFVKSF